MYDLAASDISVSPVHHVIPGEEGGSAALDVSQDSGVGVDHNSQESTTTEGTQEASTSGAGTRASPFYPMTPMTPMTPVTPVTERSGIIPQLQ